MHERLRVKVKVEPRSTSRLSETVHSLSLLHLRE